MMSVNAAATVRRERRRLSSGPPAGPPSKLATLDDGERFAAYLAHELRTPLATQRALLELVLADEATDAAQWREIAEEVLLACGQQERLLRACLALARSRPRAERCEPVDLSLVVAGALRAHDPGGLERVVLLEPAWTSGDADLLERLVDNLVSNAIRHNVAGGRFEAVTLARSGSAVFTIANTGPPIPAGELERLFQPFQRLDPGPGSLSEGLGLGLAIVQAIAEAHSATVAARVRGGGGLEITASFPATCGTAR